MFGQDILKLVKHLVLPKDEIILDLGAGDGTQIKQLQAIGYSYALGVDLIGNPPFVQQDDMRKFLWRDFTRPISLIFFRYSLHRLDIDSIKRILFRACIILRDKGYLYIVTFDKNDPIVSTGHTVKELNSFLPKEIKAIESSIETQKDENPYPHEHRIIRVLFQKEKIK